jgi:hypothetical protein
MIVSVFAGGTTEAEWLSKAGVMLCYRFPSGNLNYCHWNYYSGMITTVLQMGKVSKAARRESDIDCTGILAVDLSALSSLLTASLK